MESGWPLFEAYVAAFVSADGRVIDRTDGEKSTSEGQAYGLFFALVANDRPLFDRILEWTRKNLARGDLGAHLPAWKWGRAEDGSWKVLDPNAASDADLWIGYALLEAGRLWSEPRYEKLGRKLLKLVVKEEIATLPGLGPMLLPGPVGFVREKGTAWRLNPSYLPPQLLRRLAAAEVPGPWSGVLESTRRMLASAPGGLVPDWTVYRREGGFGPDPIHGSVGSYDAIRVHLWAGMLPAGDPLREAIGPGFYELFLRRGTVPERVGTGGELDGPAGPPGFSAVLLPEAQIRSDAEGAARLEADLAKNWTGALYGSPAAYYDQNLVLFARGYVEGRYGFGSDGRLQTRWGMGCER